MPITTWTQAQLILGLPAAEQTRVEALIPLVEEDYLHIRNKPFDVGNVLTVATGAANDGDVTITVNGTDFDVTVAAGDNTIIVARKIMFRLLRLFNVTSAGNTVTFMGHTTLAFNGAGTGATATAAGVDIIYPTGAELTAIKMIQFHMTAGAVAGGLGKTSETLGDYSVTFAGGQGTSIGDYPKDVVGGIKRYVSFT